MHCIAHLGKNIEFKNITMSNKECKSDNTYCSVPQCKSMGSRNPELSFHKFPDVKYNVVRACPENQQKIMVNKRLLWKLLLRVGKPITPFMRVCSKHFKEDDYNLPMGMSQRRRLKRSAVPSRHLPVPITDVLVEKVAEQKLARKRQVHHKELNRKKQEVLQKKHTVESLPSLSSSSVQEA